MAVRASADRRFLSVRSRETREPLCVCELSRHVTALAQFEIDDSRRTGNERGGYVALQVVPGATNPDRVLPRFQSRLRKPIATVAITDDGNRRGGRGSFGADEHAFHRPFLIGSDQT